MTTAVEGINTMFEPEVGKLSERAMNVELHLSCWHAQRIDRQTTREVLQERHAAADGGKFEKFLVPRKALKSVMDAHAQARRQHYKLTLPWGNNGIRIVSSMAFFDYTSLMQAERFNCNGQHREFLALYPQYRAEAPARLGVRLFNASDFPTPQEMITKFGFRLEITPVPDKDDFRVTLGAEIEEQIRNDIEATVTNRLGEAQRDLWVRVFDTLKHFAETMRDDEKVFRNTTLTKLAELATLAPKLSLTPDSRLDEICADVLSITDGLSPDDLRDNKRIRTAAAHQARAALAKIEEAMAGAF